MYVETLGAGPRLVLVHGSVGSGRAAWARQEPLAERFELAVVTRSGYPPHPPPDGTLDFEEQAAELAAALAGSAVVLLALPIFLLGGFPLAGWLLGAALWAGAQALGAVLARLPLGAVNLAASGVVGFGMMVRAVAVVVGLIAVATVAPSVALAAALVYAAGYTLELVLGVVLYFQGEPVA